MLSVTPSHGRASAAAGGISSHGKYTGTSFTIRKSKSILALLPGAREFDDWINLPPLGNWAITTLNIVTLPLKWLLFTKMSLVCCPPSEIRERVSNQTSILGSVAALFVVISISSYLTTSTWNPAGKVTWYLFIMEKYADNLFCFSFNSKLPI